MSEDVVAGGPLAAQTGRRRCLGQRKREGEAAGEALGARERSMAARESHVYLIGRWARRYRHARVARRTNCQPNAYIDGLGGQEFDAWHKRLTNPAEDASKEAPGRPPSLLPVLLPRLLLPKLDVEKSRLTRRSRRVSRTVRTAAGHPGWLACLAYAADPFSNRCLARPVLFENYRRGREAD